MSNYTHNYLNLPLNSLKNIKYHASQKVDGCNVILIQADTIRKDYYTCDKCGSVHKHTIKEYKPIFNKFSVLNNNLVILNINKKTLNALIIVGLSQNRYLILISTPEYRIILKN